MSSTVLDLNSNELYENLMIEHSFQFCHGSIIDYSLLIHYVYWKTGLNEIIIQNHSQLRFKICKRFISDHFSSGRINLNADVIFYSSQFFINIIFVTGW